MENPAGAVKPAVPYVVGLTGGIGSGKSTVAEHFRSLGVEVIDADRLARRAAAPGAPAFERIRERFGEACLAPDGGLDRAWMRRTVFADPERRRWLEKLLHPAIGRMIEDELARRRSAYCLLVSPLLLETGQRRLVDRVLVVDVEEETQLRRAGRRDGGGPGVLRAIMEAQMPRRERLDGADDVLDNEPPPDTLAERVLALHRRYLELAGRRMPAPS